MKGIPWGLEEEEAIGVKSNGGFGENPIKKTGFRRFEGPRSGSGVKARGPRSHSDSNSHGEGRGWGEEKKGRSEE